MLGPVKMSAAVALALTLAQQGASVTYVDPRGRFEFTYPAAFGDTSPGTNDGFGDRVAAIRFSSLASAGHLGGEAALTRGFPLVDLQAAGGLYDSIALEIFPESLRRTIARILPPLAAASFCQEAVRPQHLDPASAALAILTAQQRTAVGLVDRMRNVDARLVRCVVDGNTVTFDKETASESGGPRQRIYGAVRFLEGDYSTFQIILGSSSGPDQSTLDDVTATVNSWKSRP